MGYRARSRALLFMHLNTCKHYVHTHGQEARLHESFYTTWPRVFVAVEAAPLRPHWCKQLWALGFAYNPGPSASAIRKWEGPETRAELSINHLFTLRSGCRGDRRQAGKSAVLIKGVIAPQRPLSTPSCRSSAPSLCLFWNKNKINRSDVLFIFPLLPSPPHNKQSREERIPW